MKFIKIFSGFRENYVYINIDKIIALTELNDDAYARKHCGDLTTIICDDDASFHVNVEPEKVMEAIQAAANL
jgi:hypothetical protein